MLSFSDLEQIQRLMTKAFKEHKEMEHSEPNTSRDGCCDGDCCNTHKEFIPFETFADYLERIENVANIMESLNKLGFDIYDSELNTIDLMIEMLATMMHDTEDIIAWYCWELDFGADGEDVLALDDGLHDMTCAEELYEYLTI